MKIEEIKMNVSREDLMIASVKTGFAPSTIYCLLNGHRKINDEHAELMQLLESIADYNINALQIKLDVFELDVFALDLLKRKAA